MKKICLLLMTLVSLTACTTPGIYGVEKIVRPAGTPSAVVIADRPYVDLRPYHHRHARVLHRAAKMAHVISLRGQQLPFHFYTEMLAAQTGLTVYCRAGVNRQRLVSLNYQGTIAGALRALAVATGYRYHLFAHRLTWSPRSAKESV